jgi:hypothetical protein
MLCKVWGFHWGTYEEYRLLGYKNSVRTSQETYYVSTTELSRLMLCKIWGFHGSNYERMAYSGMLRCVAIVRTDVSVYVSASIIRVTRIGELGTLALLVTQTMETLNSFETSVLREPQILICYFRSQILELWHIFKWFVSYFYIPILACILVPRHQHILSFLYVYF